MVMKWRGEKMLSYWNAPNGEKDYSSIFLVKYGNEELRVAMMLSLT